MTESQRSDIARRYRAGESANALAKDLGIDRRTATRIIRRAGVEVRCRVVERIDVGVAAELYASGLSLKAVGERIGMSARPVLNAFRAAGIAIRSVGSNQRSG